MGVEFNRLCGGVKAGGTLCGAGEGSVKGVQEDLLAGFGKEVKAVSAIVVKYQNGIQQNSMDSTCVGGSTGKVLGAQPTLVMPVGYRRQPVDSQEKDASTLSGSIDIAFGMLHAGVSS